MNLDQLLETVRKNHNAFRAIYYQEKAIRVRLLKQCCTCSRVLYNFWYRGKSFIIQNQKNESANFLKGNATKRYL